MSMTGLIIGSRGYQSRVTNIASTTDIATETSRAMAAEAALAASSSAPAWNAVTGKPTTVEGFGITDYNTLGDARWSSISHTHSYSALTGLPTLGTAAAQSTTAFDASGAAATAQAFAIQRANHTGTQVASTITGLATVATSGSYVDLTNKPAVPSTVSISLPSVGNAITIGTAFQPRSVGPCHIVVTASLTGALGLNELVTVAMSATSGGTYITIGTERLLIGVLGLVDDRTICSFPVPTGYWVKITRSGSAASATYSRFDIGLS